MVDIRRSQHNLTKKAFIKKFWPSEPTSSSSNHQMTVPWCIIYWCLSNLWSTTTIFYQIFISCLRLWESRYPTTDIFVREKKIISELLNSDYIYLSNVCYHKYVFFFNWQKWYGNCVPSIHLGDIRSDQCSYHIYFEEESECSWGWFQKKVMQMQQNGNTSLCSFDHDYQRQLIMKSFLSFYGLLCLYDVVNMVQYRCVPVLFDLIKWE